MEIKRKMNPFNIEREIILQLKGKPADISISGRNCILSGVNNEHRSRLIRTLSCLVENSKAFISHQQMNLSEDIIFVSDRH